MAQSIYGVIRYGDGKYGQKPQLKISANPFTTLALDYSTVRVSWANPVADSSTPFIGIRLVRNFDQFPEHAEDGKILIESRGTNPVLIPGISYFDDDELISGQFVYYGIFLLMSNDYLEAPLEWLSAGETYGLVPLPHHTVTPNNTYKSLVSNGAIINQRIDQQILLSTHDKFMRNIPAIFHGEDLNTFLTPFSFVLDEIMTYADVTKPDLSGRRTNPTVLNLQSFQLALPFESGGVTRAQKKLVRDAIWTYGRKGTAAGLERFVENITGYSSTITVLPNLFLSMQDSTFYQGIGNWTGSSGVTITAERSGTYTTVASGEVVFDLEWHGKIVTTVVGSTVSLGMSDPTTKGIPVTGLTTYHLSYLVNTSSSYFPSIHWFDSLGNLVSVNEATSGSGTGAWAVVDNEFTSPATAVKAVVQFYFDSIGTHRLDRLQLRVPPTGSYSTPLPYTEPRTVDIFLNPDKTNYISNPSFETNTSGWTATNVTISSVSAGSSEVLAPVGVPNGTKLLKSVFGSGAATLIEGGCTPAPGYYYTFSTYHATKTGTKDLNLNLKATFNTAILNSKVVSSVATIWFSEEHFFQVGDAISFTGTTYLNSIASTVLSVGSNYVTCAAAVTAYGQMVDTGNAVLTLSSTTSVTANTTWARSSTTLWVPENFPYDLTSRYTTVTPSITSSTSGTVYFEAAQLEPKITATDYFDGSLIYQGAVWSGSADASSSYLYTNHTRHRGRLDTTVMDYLPKNTTYVVRDYISDSNSSTVVKLA